MAQGNRAAMKVNFVVHLVQQVQILEYWQRLGRERLVQLHHFYIVHGHAQFLQYFLGRGHRAIAHDGRIDTSQRHAPHLRDRCKAQGLGLLRGHHQHGRGAV